MSLILQAARHVLSLMHHRILIFSLLMANWVFFSGKMDGAHLTMGVICSLFVTWLSGDLLFPDRSSTIGRRLNQAGRMIGYIVWLLWQIILANFQVLKIALSPNARRLVQPTVVAHRTPLQSDFEKFILANSITLTPGTVTARIDGDTFFVHAINQEAAAGLNGEMDRRIAQIFDAAPPHPPES